MNSDSLFWLTTCSAYTTKPPYLYYWCVLHVYQRFVAFLFCQKIGLDPLSRIWRKQYNLINSFSDVIISKPLLSKFDIIHDIIHLSFSQLGNSANIVWNACI